MNRLKERGPLLACAVVVALALATLGTGSQAAGGTQVSRVALIAAASLGALAVLAVAIANRWRIFSRPSLRAAGALGALALLVALGALLVHFSHGARAIGGPAPGVDVSLRPFALNVHVVPDAPHHAGRVSPVAPAVGGGLILVLLVAAAVIALLARRRRRPAEEAASAQAVMYAAVEAGDDAMRDVADPREAIIACYAAMEQVLADAGVHRLAAETPDELLARAAASNQAPNAARRLTELFLEARYSTHRMTDADRDAARTALGELRQASEIASGDDAVPPDSKAMAR